VGCASDQNLEAIADLKISANGTARIEETHEWTLGGCRNNCQNQEEWDPHNSPIRVHSTRAMYWPRIPAGSRQGFTDDPAGRQCSFWSSDSVLGNRPVSPPALPISPDNAPGRAGVTTVWFGSFDSLANQPNGPPVSGNAVYRPQTSD